MYTRITKMDILNKATEDDGALDGVTCHLAAVMPTPTPDILPGSITYCDFSGYAPQSVTWGAAWYDDEQICRVSSQLMTFKMTGPNGGDVVGVILRRGDAVLAAKLIDPVSLVQPGDGIAIVVHATMQGLDVTVE